MKSTPFSTAARTTARAPSRSAGSPQIPFPVIRMAPNPSRVTVPRFWMSIVPAALMLMGPLYAAAEQLARTTGRHEPVRYRHTILPRGPAMNNADLDHSPVPIPHALAGGVGATPAGAAWLQRLPQLVQRAQQRWGLHLQAPFGVGTTAWTAPGTCADGTPIVLKVTFPHDEAHGEATALRLWRGLAAVELLDHQRQDWALLLRRAHPGTLLLHDPAPETVRLNHGLQVLANLHRAKAANAPLAQLPVVSGTWAGIASARAHRWQHLLHGVAAPVAAGLDLLHRFADPAAMPAPQVVLHGDLNPGNLLLDSPPDRPAHWLAIDPKPMLGDPAYEDRQSTRLNP